MPPHMKISWNVMSSYLVWSLPLCFSEKKLVWSTDFFYPALFVTHSS
jgi:hypothetical protein